MKVVYVTRWYSEGMGYIENCLPHAVASLGHEVHIITSTAQVYYDKPFYQKVYSNYLGDPILKPCTYKDKNVTIHRLNFFTRGEHIVIRHLIKTIRQIKPDIVHVFEHTAIDTYRIALLKIFSSFKFFTGNHSVLSVFPIATQWDRTPFFNRLKWNLFSKFPGKLVSFLIEKCYVVTEDAAHIAHQFMGVQSKKIEVSTLGVDTESFFPLSEKAKQERKKSLGFDVSEILCVYTGRFTSEKNPLIVAEAIEELAEKGYPYRALFVGEGEQKQTIQNLRYSRVIDFIPFKELPAIYQSGDIGIWPSQESTSQLDAVASGLNLVLTSNIKGYAIIESGNSEQRPRIVSRFYDHCDKEDLKKQLLSLREEAVRAKLAKLGVKEIEEKYSWSKIAKKRILDYSKFHSVDASATRAIFFLFV